MAMAEVYEVATFYHHFDVVKEGDTPPPAITVRVCDSIACELAGAHELLATLQSRLGAGVRVLHAPCVGRCETAPVAVVGQHPIPHATAAPVSAAVDAGYVTHPASGIVTPGHIDYAAYRAAGGYALAAACVAGSKTAGGRHRRDGETPACAASAAPASPPAASGSWSRPSLRRACWRSTSTRASPGHSRTVTISSAIRTAFSKARSSRRGRSASTRSISTFATSITAAGRFSSARSRRCRRILRTRFRRSICDAAPARISAAKSPR